MGELRDQDQPDQDQPERDDDGPTSAAPGSGSARLLLEGTPNTPAVVLGWCIWLGGSWALVLALGTLLPAARWLVTLSLVGLMVVWPAVRLSERSVRLAPVVILVEWFCLIGVFQAVVWMLGPISDWRVDQTAWLDGAVVAWSLLSAAVVALAMQWREMGARLAGMVICLLLAFGEPAAMVVASGFYSPADGPMWVMRLNPWPTLWALSHPVTDVTLGVWPGRVLTAAAGALAAWAVVWVMAWVVSWRERGGGWEPM